MSAAAHILSIDPAVPAAEPEPPRSAANGAPRSRAEINRANAQRSTGPRTPEGKARAAVNALQHGLFSAGVVLPGEDREAFEALRREYVRDYQAETPKELSLIQEIVDCRWRMGRVVARENALFILTAEQQRSAVEQMFHADDEIAAALAQAAGFQANARAFNQLSIGESRLYRRSELAERKLAALVYARRASAVQQTEQLRIPAEPDPVAAQPAPDHPAFDQPALGKAGFVPPPSAERALPAGSPQFPGNMPVFTGPLKKENRRQWLRKHGYNRLAKAA